MTKVCVVGAGTIGSLLAGHLARVAEVSVLTRRDEHATRAARARPARLRRRRLHGGPSAAADRRAARGADLGIFACKAPTSSRARRRLAGRSRRDGDDDPERARRRGDRRARTATWPLVSAVTFMSGIRHADAHVEYELDTATWLGPVRAARPRSTRAQEIAALHVAPGLQAEPFPDLRPAQWSKLIFNATINTVAALTDLPHVGAFARDERADRSRPARPRPDRRGQARLRPRPASSCTTIPGR